MASGGRIRLVSLSRVWLGKLGWPYVLNLIANIDSSCTGVTIASDRGGWLAHFVGEISLLGNALDETQE